ncbi:unnamed protein product [Spirodela intermedia]|uniref:Uncharacterized protein n=2 Tax=Spirodela intermedia TaxID=51605 RepID=A0A7I8IR32_SPIIN|nr:unnamed protein product [Spirodela intermedia]CAA6660321.1 unnamed protein product [Spirodela intermedia]CAA7396656.1 unnamed protein product [Spirodela intermedia]
MDSRRVSAFLLLAVVVVAVLSMAGTAQAARPPPGQFDGESFLTYPSVYERAKSAIESMMQKLPSGPSPRGPGH